VIPPAFRERTLSDYSNIAMFFIIIVFRISIFLLLSTYVVLCVTKAIYRCFFVSIIFFIFIFSYIYFYFLLPILFNE